METKINIAEILKNKPQGTKLYNLLYNINVELDTIVTTGTKTIIWCTDKIDNTDVCHRFYSEFGTIEGYPDGLQILLPSKEMRDWNKFAWKKGDVLMSDNEKVEVIFEKFVDDTYQSFIGKHHLDNLEDNLYYQNEGEYLTNIFNTESKDAAQTYVKTLEKKLGGKLNRETLEVEKVQPEFKDGDIVCISGMGYLAYGIVKSINNSSKKLEYYVLNDMSTLKFEDWLSFEDKQIQPITETQQIILFDALARENKAWNAEKIQIVDLKPKVELKPFDKVLVRDYNYSVWKVSLFGYKSPNNNYYYCCNGSSWIYCIPYEGNEHLLGTTKDVEV